MHFPAWSLQTLFLKTWAEFSSAYIDSIVQKYVWVSLCVNKPFQNVHGENTSVKIRLKDLHFSLHISNKHVILGNEVTWTGLSSSNKLSCVAVYPFVILFHKSLVKYQYKIHSYVSLHWVLNNRHSLDHNLLLEHSVEIYFCCQTLILM